MQQRRKEEITILVFVFTSLQIVSTKPTVSDNNSGLSPEFLAKENETLVALMTESIKTGFPFEGAWNISELNTFYIIYENYTGVKSKDLKAVYRQPEILNLAEIRILISYCYKVPPFFQYLNRDLREGHNTYPKATSVLKEAILKLQKYQDGTPQGLPSDLYRNEPTSLFPMYQQLLMSASKTGILKQFTSSSRSEKKAEEFAPGPDRMVIKFEKPQVGADVDDFSIFDEYEVLLPVSATYQVKTATKKIVNDTETYDVVIIGPYSGQTFNKRNIYLVTMSFVLFILK